MRVALILFALLGLAAPARAAGRAMTVDDLLAVKSVSDPQVAPDGRYVVYVVSAVDRDKNRSNSDLWLVPVAGGEPRRLTYSPGTDNHPRWSPDGSKIAFVSDRSGSPQVWLLPLEGGGEARQLTKLPIGVSGPIWSPKGDKIAFTARVYPGKTPEETEKKDKEKAEAKTKAMIFDRLMVRHWDEWDDEKRSHLFVADASTGEAKDLTPKLEVNTPPAPFGDSSDYAFAPDGKTLAFTAEPMKDLAWSTNTDVWEVSVDGGDARNLTEDNPGADASPAYSPDGKRLAYRSQKRAGFEADLWALKVFDRESGRTNDRVSAWMDRPVQSFVWAGEDRLLASVDRNGQVDLVAFSTTKPEGDATRMISTPGSKTSAVATRDGKTFVFVQSRAHQPPELYKAEGPDGKPARLTRHNADLAEKLDLREAEPFTFTGAEGAKVGGWLIRPPGFDESKRYPVVFLIHGGPQGAWHDEWHARWNYALFAAPGHAVVAINPRGSTGYGQEFTDQISRDWSGKVVEDLNRGLDHALKTFTFLDGDRVAAAGGSFGGYMVNWLAGHSDRFKALISHAGVFEVPSMNLTTEELWFSEWEFNGPPWKDPQLQRAQSPSTSAERFATPTLVIHGAFDFRVPDAQGLGMFTALQRRGIPSRLVYFPDEGHWILKPGNRVVWWREVHGWLAKYLKP